MVFKIVGRAASTRDSKRRMQFYNPALDANSMIRAQIYHYEPRYDAVKRGSSGMRVKHHRPPQRQIQSVSLLDLAIL